MSTPNADLVVFFMFYRSSLYYYVILLFFFHDTATTEIYTLSLHDALPISFIPRLTRRRNPLRPLQGFRLRGGPAVIRSEEHTSELQSPVHLVCRLLLEKKKKHRTHQNTPSKYILIIIFAIVYVIPISRSGC